MYSEMQEILSWKDREEKINTLNTQLKSWESIGWTICSNLIELIWWKLYYNEKTNSVINWEDTKNENINFYRKL